MRPHRSIIKQSGSEALDRSICEVISLCSACSGQVVSQFDSSGFSGLVTDRRGSCVSVSLGFARPCYMQDNGLLSCLGQVPLGTTRQPRSMRVRMVAPHLRNHACASSACLHPDLNIILARLCGFISHAAGSRLCSRPSDQVVSCGVTGHTIGGWESPVSVLGVPVPAACNTKA